MRTASYWGFFDDFLEPLDLQVFVNGGHTIFLQFLMMVVLLDVPVHVGLEGKTLSLPLIAVFFAILINTLFDCRGHHRPKEMNVKHLVGLPAILGLDELLGISSDGGFAPILLQHIKNCSIVGQKGWVPGASLFSPAPPLLSLHPSLP